MSNGQFVYTGVEFGDTATAVCDEGWDKQSLQYDVSLSPVVLYILGIDFLIDLSPGLYS